MLPKVAKDSTMKGFRRHAVASCTAFAVLAAPALSCAETTRVGLPTKTFRPTTVAKTAVRQRLFEKEGIGAELTIYRSGAELLQAWRRARQTSFSIRPRWYRPPAQEGRDIENRCQCQDGQLRMAIDGSDKIRTRGERPQRQEGRDHRGRVRLGPTRAVDHAGQED
jgi:hypothetical protein